MTLRWILLLALASTGCGGDDGASQRVRHQRAAAARAGLYAIQAAPGGAIARFSDVRLIGANVVCGTVDAQDGVGPRAFGFAQGEVTIEQPGDAATRAAVAERCKGGPARRVVSRNVAYTDISVEDDPS